MVHPRILRLTLTGWTVCILACGILLLPQPVLAQDRTGIATKNLDLWEQRSKEAEVLLSVPAGTRLKVTGRARKGFYPVSFGGEKGWALTGSVAITVGSERGRGNDERPERSLRGFATEDLNLRTGPSTRDRVRAVIPSGRDVELTGIEDGGFVAVTYGSEAGWVAKEYVRPEDEPAPERLTLRGNPRHLTPDEIVPYIYAAADYYGQPREDMLRVAQCESDLVPMAVNEEGGSYGVFQFKTGTWLSTPYADYDIFDPRASAYAAAWMWSVGRRNEWVCQ